ncbi:MAG: glucose-1-phosphate adenylyltransferase subunit GlgD [Ruminococcaceae bacterium]|nr:glucose-1-phosphate adenylyltransferase subunit GlgD [Oscillospiraceae bacterium]
MNTAMGIIFASIYDDNLGDLTNKRTMAAVPYGGRYRQIDFPLSNMTNSGIRHIGIITKHKHQSLMNHIGSGQEWDLDLEEGGLEFLTPFALDHNGLYRGKLDAINSAINFLTISNEEFVVLADSSVLCAIDFREVIENHIASEADVTVVVKDGISDGKKHIDMGIKLDESGKVKDIVVETNAKKEYLASMGIFVMRREKLIEAVKDCVAHDRYQFERDIVLHGFTEENRAVNACVFDGVVLYNESISEYYENTLALLDPKVRHGLFNRPNLTIYTKVRDEVPSSYGENSVIDNCLAADGCVLNGKAENTVFFRGAKLAETAVVRDSIIMQETVIGDGADLQYVILDKDVVVRPGKKLCGTKEHPIVLKRGEIV